VLRAGVSWRNLMQISGNVCFAAGLPALADAIERGASAEHIDALIAGFDCRRS
jgi:hypothetical protein